MLRGSDASDAEAEARQLALGPPNELAVLAALSDADIIDVSGAEPIFDLLDTNGDGRLSAVISGKFNNFLSPYCPLSSM